MLAKQASGASDTNTAAVANNNDIGPGHGGIGFEPGFGQSPGRRGECFPVEVSAEYLQKVTAIAENDTDVQNLLAGGYNITSVRPIIKNVVDADGYMTARAATAVLLMQKDANNVACVSVDIDLGTVTQIITSTRTVIDEFLA